MIALAEARALIADNISPLPAVTAPLAAAAGRILRQNISAPADVPGFDRSAMDGYAVAADDSSPKFRIVGEIQPGAVWRRRIHAGECVRVFTGAPLPAGASQVLMQEDVRADGGFMAPLKRGRESHIHRRGDDARQGDLLLESGMRLGPGELALLASLGRTRVKVSPVVRVAHFATGNELVGPEAKPGPGQIRDSNSTLVAALMGQFGARLTCQERVADDLERLVKKARSLKRTFDLLLVSGGASVGDYDHGKRLLAALGFQIHFAAVNLRPGKPLVFATRNRQAAFIVPGNPVSHLVTLQVAVRLAIERFAGAAPVWPLVKMRLTEAFDFRPGARETFWPASVGLDSPAGGRLVARAVHWQSSGDVTGLTGVNGLLQLPPGAPAPKAGGEIPVLMLDRP
jgi:molybdopterin molybdotransferase